MKDNLDPKQFTKHSILLDSKERIAVVMKRYWDYKFALIRGDTKPEKNSLSEGLKIFADVLESVKAE